MAFRRNNASDDREPRGRGRRDRDDAHEEGGDDGDDRRNRRGRRQGAYCPEGRCFDYKNIDQLRRFVTESGKIKPRRQTGNCSRCQRELAREVKRARHLALLPYISSVD
ncbi:MAG: 30S ribosomal protein S18 [Armatimonadetes bacterium]|nr:30S ribosomal protein S18 [Anaerolineae bacterium]